jgi:hypothetical protein
MRVLVISPIFPPRADSEAFCGGKFVQGLVDAGVQAAVICCHNIMPAYRADASECWAPLERVTVDVPNPPTPPLAVRCRLGLKYRTTAWTGWTAAAVSKALELHRKSPFDLVVSRSYPWHAHVAGYWVASDLRIPWVANLNDPWDLSPFIADDASREDWKQDRNATRWRRRVLARADIVTFPCDRLRDYSLQDHPRPSQVHVVPHIGTARTSAEHAREFVIVHAGKLRMHEATGRRANAVIDGLPELFKSRGAARSRTRLVFVGPEDPVTREYVAQLGLSKEVIWAGQVSYETSLQHIARAAVCLLVEADLEIGIFLPSKLCDYIAARKPVLALSPAVGTVNDLARDGQGIMRVDPRDSRGVSKALTTLFDAFDRGGLAAYAPPESLLQRYEPNTVIRDFLEAVQQLKSKRDRPPSISRSFLAPSALR